MYNKIINPQKSTPPPALKTVILCKMRNCYNRY